MLTLTLFCSAPAVTLLGLLIRHVVWNYGCCYCLPCCQPEPPPKIKRLAAALDSIETYRWAVDWFWWMMVEYVNGIECDLLQDWSAGEAA